MALFNLKKIIREWLAEGDEQSSPDAVSVTPNEPPTPPQTQESIDLYIAALRDAAMKAYPGADFMFSGSLDGVTVGFSSHVIPCRPSALAALYILATRPDLNQVAFEAVYERQRKNGEIPVNLNQMRTKGGITNDPALLDEYEQIQKNKIKLN